MIPCHFKEANRFIGPPEGVADTDVHRAPAFIGQLLSGPLDGSMVVITAWVPTNEEMHKIVSGKPIYLLTVGMMPPVILSTEFPDEVKPIE